MLTDGVAYVRSEQVDLVRQAVLSDAFLWCRVVCQHTELSPWFHRPLAYLLDGDAEKLVKTLNNPKYIERSYPVREIRKRLQLQHKVDWNSHEGFRRLFELLDFVSLVAYRSSAKSSLGHDLDAKAITIDPDDHTLIVSAADDRAMTFSKQVRDTINSDLYRALFPNRVPDDPKDLTESSIKLKGRRLGRSPQPSLEARGYTARIVGAHYRRFSVDDLLVDTNAYDVEGVYRFLLGMPGLYEPTRIVRRHYHTVYHERGDQWLLSNTPNCFQLVIPIEDHGGDQPEDISLRGVPTNPDWHPLDKIQALYDQIIADEKEGGRSWRMNFLLDPSAGGGAVFPAAVVDDRVWQWVDWRDPRSSEIRKVIGKPVYDEKGARVVKDGAFLHAAIPPERLFIVLGCDPAISDREDSDEWAVAVHGRDVDGCEFILETLHGHDLENMGAALLYLSDKWKPRVVGIEKAGAQGAIIKWLDNDDRYRRIKSRVVEVPITGQSKEIGIQNGVAEPMKARRFFTARQDKGCLDGREQAKAFKPFTKHRRDDILDSWVIAGRASRRPARKEEVKKTLDRLAQQYKARVDPDTGVYIGY